jgi:L-rhamnose mutarotase
MKKVAFKMHLHPGQAAEYRRRHDELWPELAALLKDTGVSDYSIFLDEETNGLFGVLKTENPAALDELPKHPVMRRWWAYMADIMETNADKSPVSVPLEEVFYLR